MLPLDCVLIDAKSNNCFSLQRSKDEKEQKVAILEEAKGAIERELRELRANLREVEKSRMEARRELQELRRQVCASHIFK